MKNQIIKQTTYYAPFEDFDRLKIASRYSTCDTDIKLTIYLAGDGNDTVGMFKHYTTANLTMLRILLEINNEFKLETVKTDIVQPNPRGEARMVLLLNKTDFNKLTPDDLDNLFSFLDGKDEIVTSVLAYVKDPYFSNYINSK